MANTYSRGTLLRVSTAFLNSSAAADSPDTVTWEVKTPAGVNSAPATTNDSAGVDHIDINLNASGRWIYRVVGDANPQASAWAEVLVRKDPFE